MKQILLSFAHPDDETFATGGTVAKYVEEGWRVDLLCATLGQKGQTGPLGDLSPEALGEARQKEVEAAGTILGISSITFLGYKDGSVASIESGDIEEKLYQKMIELMPDVVITFDTTGYSNHPDHVRMCFATTYAFQKYATWVADQLPEADKEAVEQVEPKLYYVCLPETLVDYLKEEKILPSESFGKPWKGTHDKAITHVIDIKAFADVKKEAIAAHVSQQDDGQRLLASKQLFSQEYFILRMKGQEEVFMGKNDRVEEEL